MKEQLHQIAQAVQTQVGRLAHAVAAGARRGTATLTGSRRLLATLALAGLGAWALVAHPPLQTVAPGEAGVRLNGFSGASEEFQSGPVWLLPGVHELRRISLRERSLRLEEGRKADGEAPYQSLEGLSLGIDLVVRYAVDAARVAQVARTLPQDMDAELVRPAIEGVVFKTFARHTVREIFSTRRADIQAAIEAELKPRLAADGIVLRAVQIGQVDLPADYRAGLDKLLAEELQSEKMRYTLALKEKRVKETELEAQADKVRRETQAAAAAQEQIIAAKAQEEAMRHVLPFKQKQIEQRQLEAEAVKLARIKAAEGEAQARRIEAAGEADSRRKLAEVEAERIDKLGQVASAQMARDGELITRHPLLIQKTVADKLSDKIQVIIAPPGTDGRFIAAGLIGSPGAAAGGTTVAQKQEQ